MIKKIKEIAEPYRVAYQFEKRAECMKAGKLYGLEVDITAKCNSGCSYCYAGSVSKWDTSKELSTEEWKNFFDEALGMGIKCFSWPGGDPLLRPDWYELLRYVKEKGDSDVRHFFASPFSSLRNIEDAKKVVEVADDLLIHFDSINKAVFMETHPRKSSPINEWERSLRGIHLLLEAGFNPGNMHLAIPIMKPLLKDIEATFDYFFDFIGVGSYAGGVFKPAGRGKEIAKLAPSLEDIKYVYELRAKKMKNLAMLNVGPTATGKLYCETTIAISPEGNVKGCDTLPENRVVGNIREKSLQKIWEENKHHLRCQSPKGYCSECENSQICFGCRANAYYIGMDWSGSDPTCWKNPDGPRAYAEYLSKIMASEETLSSDLSPCGH